MNSSQATESIKGIADDLTKQLEGSNTQQDQIKNLNGSLITKDPEPKQTPSASDQQKIDDDVKQGIENELRQKEELAAKNKAATENQEEINKVKEVDLEEDDEDNFEGVEGLDEEDKNYLKELAAERKLAPVAKGEVKPAKEIVESDEDYVRPYKEKATAYDEIEKDPLSKAFIEFRKKGGSDINQFVKELGIVDVERMTPEQIFEADTKSLGLSEDGLAEEMERFNSLSEAQKLRETNPIKKQMIQDRDEKIKTFSAGVNKEAQAQEAFMNEAASVGKKVLGETLSKMEGKKYKGLLITSEMANEIKDYVSNNTVPKIENGKFTGYDIEKSVRMAVLDKYEKQLLMANHQMGKTFGMDKALKLRLRPNRVESGTGGTPRLEITKKESVEAETDKLWEKRTGKNKAN